MPVMTETAAVNASTPPFNPISPARGILPGLIGQDCVGAPAAIATPSPPPSDAEQHAFGQQLPYDAPRPAPIAGRTAISGPRDAPAPAASWRRSRRRSTRRNLRRQTKPIGREPASATMESFSGATRNLPALISRRELFSNAAAICAISARACSMVTPGFNRARCKGPYDYRALDKRRCRSAVRPKPINQLALDIESRRRHADDGVILIVQCDRLVDNIRIAAETPLPQPVA